MQRKDLSDYLNISESSLKKHMLGKISSKTRKALMENVWKNLSEEERSSRVKSTIGKGNRFTPERRKNSIRTLMLAREAQEKLRITHKELILNNLNSGISIDYNYTNCKIYREFRNGSEKCDICNRKDSGRNYKNSSKMFIDHCHKTNIIRGLLCFQCNCFLGWIEGNLSKIEKYLNKPSSGIPRFSDLVIRSGILSCEICGKSEEYGLYKTVVDHCHKTGFFRGYLCSNCNGKLGKFEKHPEFLLYINSRKREV